MKGSRKAAYNQRVKGEEGRTSFRSILDSILSHMRSKEAASVAEVTKGITGGFKVGKVT